MRISFCMATAVLVASLSSVTAASVNTEIITPYTLEQAINRALELDPWLKANRYREQSELHRSEGAASLPDPKFNVGFKNLPTDTFDFDQEGMTQFSVGISQMFPRGQSLTLNSRKLQQKANQHPFLRQERRAAVQLKVSELWLAALKAQMSIDLINENRGLFEQLSDIATSSYSSAFGRARQQDLVRAELELTSLDDRLTQLHQQKEVALQKLQPWLTPVGEHRADLVTVKTLLPVLKPKADYRAINPRLIQHLIKHPSVIAVDQAIAIASTDIKLAEQQFKPEWMINASYGVRADTPSGTDRADLFSIGVSIDIPVFSTKKQVSGVKAASSEREALKTDRLLLLRNLQARYSALRAQLDRLNNRHQLYQEQLLPGLAETAEAAINGYTVNDGTFAEVVRARISELNARLIALDINVQTQQTIAAINYVLTQAGDAEVTEK